MAEVMTRRAHGPCRNLDQVLVLFCWVLTLSHAWSLPFLLSTSSSRPTPNDYDLVVIGAGASGLFAAGTASSLGSKTLLLEKSFIGGDCTNAACVPSKAVRSIANVAAATTNANSSGNWLHLAQRHASDTVHAVQSREDPSAIVERNPNLDILFVQSCKFTSAHELEILLKPSNSSSSTASYNDTAISIKSKKFLIATGASPVIPPSLEREARAAGLPLYTYRTVLNPSENDSSESSIWNMLDDGNARKHLVIAGGGPTACELGQSLTRLGKEKNLSITIVAPSILPNHDVSLRRAAIKLLTRDGIEVRLSRRVSHIIERSDGNSPKVILDDGTHLSADALLLCVGRSPESSLSTLDLYTANVQWDKKDGVLVNDATLASKTARHIYACGDCCSAIDKTQRGSAHAGWTGFHAARNAVLPSWFLVGAKSLCLTVPSVVYTHPELASVGLSYTECVKQYGRSGFDCLLVTEEGMDRADMERLERPVDIGFVELRATKVDGTILGMTACGPAAAELANEIGLAIASKLTVRNVARALHSYPSHGYLLHRIALAMATSNTLGLLAACGPIGRTLAAGGRLACRVGSIVRPSNVIPWKRKRRAKQHEWEAKGASEMLALHANGIAIDAIDSKSMKHIEFASFLDVNQNQTLCGAIKDTNKTDVKKLMSLENQRAFIGWIQSKPPQ